jgi:hypothetical protein
MSQTQTKTQKALRELGITLVLTLVGAVLFRMSLVYFPNNHTLHLIAMVIAGGLLSIGIIRLMRLFDGKA